MADHHCWLISLIFIVWVSIAPLCGVIRQSTVVHTAGKYVLVLLGFHRCCCSFSFLFFNFRQSRSILSLFFTVITVNIETSLSAVLDSEFWVVLIVIACALSPSSPFNSNSRSRCWTISSYVPFSKIRGVDGSLQMWRQFCVQQTIYHLVCVLSERFFCSLM